MTAQEFLSSLPSDPETPERAIQFRAFLRRAGESAEVRSVVREVYHLAAVGGWPQLALYDLQMLIYSLLESPHLIGDVKGDVDHLLRRPGNPSLSRSWRWVQKVARQAAA